MDLGRFSARSSLRQGLSRVDEGEHNAPLAPSVSRRDLLAGAAAAGTLIMLHPFSAQANQAYLRITETTDIEPGHDQPVGGRQLVVRAPARNQRGVRDGARAKDFIGEVKSLKIEPTGEGEAGFAKYRILL